MGETTSGVLLLSPYLKKDRYLLEVAYPIAALKALPYEEGSRLIGVIRMRLDGIYPKILREVRKESPRALIEIFVCSSATEVVKMIDEGWAIDVTYMDFAKAFDKVLHSKLVQKIRSQGIR
eukprot:g32823.t1